jgi:hypothetical protein
MQRVFESAGNDNCLLMDDIQIHPCFNYLPAVISLVIESPDDQTEA